MGRTRRPRSVAACASDEVVDGDDANGNENGDDDEEENGDEDASAQEPKQAPPLLFSCEDICFASPTMESAPGARAMMIEEMTSNAAAPARGIMRTVSEYTLKSEEEEADVEDDDVKKSGTDRSPRMKEALAMVRVGMRPAPPLLLALVPADKADDDDKKAATMACGSSARQAGTTSFFSVRR